MSPIRRLAFGTAEVYSAAALVLAFATIYLVVVGDDAIRRDREIISNFGEES